jgi:hypothetical protein
MAKRRSANKWAKIISRKTDQKNGIAKKRKIKQITVKLQTILRISEAGNKEDKFD